MPFEMGGVTFSDPILRFRKNAGKYIIETTPASNADMDPQDNVAEGVDGTGTVIGGFRMKRVGIFVTTYVAASLDGVLAAYEADLAALEESIEGFTVTTVGGTDYENCYLPPDSVQPAGQPKETETGTWWMDVVWAPVQKRKNTA